MGADNTDANATGAQQAEANNRGASPYTEPEFDSLPEETQRLMNKEKAKLGFIPNYMKVLSRRPEELQAYMAYRSALLESAGGLTPEEKSMIIVACSSFNGSLYCVIAYEANLRLNSENPGIADEISINYREADISERQKAMLDFAIKVTTDSYSITEEDFAELRKFEFSDKSIWDIATIAAFYNFANRMLNFSKVHADREFYTLGRNRII